MKAHTSSFKENIWKFGREIDSKITYELDGETIELGSEELNSVTPHYEGAILKSVMKQLDIDSNVEIPIGTILTYEFGLKVGYEYEYINYGNYVVYNVEKKEDTRSWQITCYDKMLYAMKEYDSSQIIYPITIRNYINAICNKIGLTFANASDTFANYDKTIPSELYLDADGNSLNYTFRNVLDELAEVTASTICIDNNDRLELRYINNTNDTIDEEYLKDINVNFGEKFGAVNTIILSRGGDGDKISQSIPANLPDEDKIAIQITDNQIMNDNNRADFIPDILDTLYGLEYYINDFTSTGICYYDLCDKYNVTVGSNTYSCIMFNDEVDVTQGLVEYIHTDMQEENQTEYKYTRSDDRGITQANIIAKKNEASILELTSKYNSVDGRINTVETKQTDTDRTINVISTHIDNNGNVTEVTTTTGFTFNAEGMTISDSTSDFKALHRNDGTYYKDGNTTVGQYTKDGSKQKDLSLFGVYYYGMADIDDTPMFVAQLYTDTNGEECFGHFYNGGDY